MATTTNATSASATSASASATSATSASATSASGVSQLNRVSFGTYKLKGEICQISLEMISDALSQLGITPHFDTAQLYFNEELVGQVAKALGVGLGSSGTKSGANTGGATITTKLKKYSTHAKAREMIAKSFSHLGQIHTFLLHNPTNLGYWKLLEELVVSDKVKAIGVSNYNLLELEELLATCTVKPTINQIEIHPFVNLPELTKLIEFCQLNGIKVVGHTVLAQCKFFDHPVLKAVAEFHSKSVAQIMIKWALQKNVDICLKTTSRNHLDEIIQATTGTWRLSVEQSTAIDEIHKDTQFIFYSKEQKETDKEFTVSEVPYLASVILQDLEAMKKQQSVSDMCMKMPKSHRAKTELIDALNEILFPDTSRILESNDTVSVRRFLEANRSRYDSKLKLLRKYYSTQIINANREKWQAKFSGRSCCLLSHKSAPSLAPKPESNSGLGAVPESLLGVDSEPNSGLSTEPNSVPESAPNSISSRITNPEPMPVNVAENTRIDPFIDWLSTNQPVRAPQMFTLGTMFPDGRMDMCKQVVGPTHIGKLCGAVAKNQHVKHFLLGNNIACDGGDTTGAEAMGDLMKSGSAQIETWYLAGNCLNSECIKILCQSLKSNKVCRSLWLKRNPVMELGAGYLGDLFNYNHTLELLDLHNCGLLDAGLRAFCQNVQASSADLSLKHLYLDANGITDDAETMKIFCAFLSYYKNKLESLFVSINKLGDSGCMKICQSLAGSSSLKCLVLSSNGITDLAVESIVNCALKCPNLQVLDLGYYKSTADMGESQNKITDKSVNLFRKLLSEHRNLCLLDLIKNQISVAGLEVLAKVNSQTTLHMSELTSAGEFPVYVIRHDKELLRKIKHTEMVYHIDSVYRNNM